MKITIELSTKEISELTERFGYELAMAGLAQGLNDKQRQFVKCTAGYEYARGYPHSVKKIEPEDLEVMADLMEEVKRGIEKMIGLPNWGASNGQAEG